MKIEIAKTIKISEYLAKKGIYPQREQSSSLWYLSPFREEQKASFKVNLLLNKWHDFGNDKKGDILDLVMELEQISHLNTAIEWLNNNLNIPSFSFRGDHFSKNEKVTDSSIENMHIKPLQHPALLELLRKRKIDKTLGKRYCKEVHYQLGEKNYFAIGFKNNKGGFATLNPYFKGCIVPNEISSFTSEDHTSTSIFEGFMDFLSYLTLKKQSYKETLHQDFHILNSIHNIEKLLPTLNRYDKIYCFLDNDDRGIKTFLKIAERYPKQVVNQSIHYSKYKDLNDYLTRKKI